MNWALAKTVTMTPFIAGWRVTGQPGRRPGEGRYE